MDAVDAKPISRDSVADASDDSKFIIFSLGGELYAARLVEVREVVEILPIKSVPNTVESFVGVCNLRGQIVGVIDLCRQFSISHAQNQRSVMLVFETASGAIAALVDRIESVSIITDKDIERKPNIVSLIPKRYITGIGKVENRLVTIVDLKEILSHQELVSIEGLQPKQAEGL